MQREVNKAYDNTGANRMLVIVFAVAVILAILYYVVTGWWPIAT